LIALHSVSKELGRGRLRKLVLDNISWVIPPRGRYIILGQKGSGKTTLLNIISGSRIPTSGWVERHATICPGPSLARALSAKTPRHVAAQLARLYRVAADDVVNFAVEFAGMNGAMDVPITSLPNSMRRRFGYALIYAIPFDLYLFDGSIGPQRGRFARACRQAFDARCKQAGMILLTSTPKVAERFDGTGGILHNGRIEFFPTVSEAASMFSALPRTASKSAFDADNDDDEDDDEEWI
jgi:capsular polysaccharide transport system ATP-binding protein